MRHSYVKISHSDLASILPTLGLAEFCVIKPFAKSLLSDKDAGTAIIMLDYLDRCHAADCLPLIRKLAKSNLDERAWVSIDVLHNIGGIAEMERLSRHRNLPHAISIQAMTYLLVHGKINQAAFITELNRLPGECLDQVAWRISRILGAASHGRTLLKKIARLVPHWNSALTKGGMRGIAGAE